MQQFQQQRQTRRAVEPKRDQGRVRAERQLQWRNEDPQDEVRRREQQRGQERKPF